MGVWQVCAFVGALTAPRMAGAALLCHAAAGYGNGSLTGQEMFGAASAVAGAGYSGAAFQGEAWAQYGRLGGSAIAQATPAQYQINRALAEPSFSDTLLFSGPWTGATGFVV